MKRRKPSLIRTLKRPPAWWTGESSVRISPEARGLGGAQNNSHDVVTEEDIAQIVASWTGVPVKKMTEDESQRLLHMEELLHKRVVGQDEAISAVSRALRRARAGLQDPKRPIGSFIFLGPTGVGKTELCRALGEVMFDDENALIRIDMSEYMEKHSVSRLVGSPPGYVGYEEGGQLTQKVRNKPYSVVLFDEVEKAHPDVFNILLQILDDGRLTDSNGRVVNFKNTIIVMTSNAGASTITSKRSLGFGGSVETTRDYEAMKERVMAEVKDTFRPEFINRIDDLIVFHALEPDDIRRIAGLMLGSVSKRLAQRGMKLSYGDDVIALLAEEGYDPNYGARPLRRTIQRSVEDALSEEIIAGKIALGDQVQLYVDDNNRIAFRAPASNACSACAYAGSVSRVRCSAPRLERVPFFPPGLKKSFALVLAYLPVHAI